MKKDVVRGMICLAIVAVVYILVAFLVPFEHEAAFWIGFAFGLVAIAVAAGAIYVGIGKKPDAKSRFYGFPIARIGVVYGIAQLAASIVGMALAAWLPGWIPGVVYAIGLGVAAIGLISAQMVVEEIEKQDVKLKKDVALMRDLQSRIEWMANQTGNSALKALAEEFRYSDPVSNEYLAEVEANLAMAVNELHVPMGGTGNTTMDQRCSKISALLAERNRLCKLYKKN